MIESISSKLNAAIETQELAETAYQQSALAAEQGAISETELTKASKQLEAAQKRVQELQAAKQGAEAAETLRIAQEQLARQRAEEQALAAAIQNVRSIAAEFDQTLDAIANVTKRLSAASDAVYAANPSAAVVQQLERARSNVMLVIEQRLKPFVNQSIPYFPAELERFVNHMPTVASGTTQE